MCRKGNQLQSLELKEKKPTLESFSASLCTYLLATIGSLILTRFLSKEQCDVLSLINTTLFIEVAFVKVNLKDV